MYEITPLDKQLNKQNSTTIAKPPFSHYIVGGKGSGKTTMLLNLLMKPEFYKGVFNKVFWVSPTNKLDAKLDTLREANGITTPNYKLHRLLQKKNSLLTDPIQNPKKLPEHIVKGILTNDAFLDNLDLDWLQELVKTQRYVIENYGKSISNKVLLILDDSISSKIIKTPTFRNFLLNSRHYNISTIFVSQSYMLLDRSIRINNSFISIFEVPNVENLKQVYNENPAGLDFNTWKEVYDLCTQQDFGFFSINYQNPRAYRLIRNFEEFLLLE